MPVAPTTASAHAGVMSFMRMAVGCRESFAAKEVAGAHGGCALRWDDGGDG